MAFGADEDDCMDVKGILGPNPNIDWRGTNGMWGWIGWLLLYPDTLGCEAEGDIICCLPVPVLLLDMEEPRPAKPIGAVTPAGPNRADIRRARSPAILCLVFSTCSHSFIRKVSTSANCFNFSSNLFNCNKFHTRDKDTHPIQFKYDFQ